MQCQESSVMVDPLEVYDLNMKRCIKVEVVEPVTITTRESLVRSTSFTSYQILIETNHWAFSLAFSSVRRRYSEFCWLRSKLQSHHPNKTLPPLPPKRLFHMTKFDTKVIEERRYGLGKFMQRVMRSSELLSDAALHLFLQSDLTTEEIDQKLAECVKPGLRKKTPYLLRSLSSGSSCGSEADFSDEQPTEQRRNEDLRERKSLGQESPLLLNDMVSLVITHENTDEVVLIDRPSCPSSPLEAPILSSLVCNSATESSRTSLQIPTSVIPRPFQAIPVN